MKKKKLVLRILLFLILAFCSIQVFAFNDIDGHWGKEAIEKWQGYNIISGYPNGNYGPNDFMTRGQFAIVIDKLMKYTEKASKDTYSDLDINAYYSNSILKLTKAGIMSGIGNNQSGANNTITRQEVAVIIGKVFELTPYNTEVIKYQDDNEMAEWAIGYIKSAAFRGYVKGDSNGYFNPKQNLTRAEAISIINNAIKFYYNKPGEYILDNIEGLVLINSNNVIVKNAVNNTIYIAPGTYGDIRVEGTSMQTPILITGSVNLTIGGSGAGYITAKGKGPIKITIEKGSWTDSILNKMTNPNNLTVIDKN